VFGCRFWNTLNSRSWKTNSNQCHFWVLDGILFKFLLDPPLPHLSLLFCRNPPQCTYVAVLGHSFHHMWKALKPASCSFEPLPGWKLSLTWHRDDTNYGRVSTLCRMDLCVFGWLPSGFRCRLPQPLSLTLFSDWAEARPRVLALVALERTD